MTGLNMANISSLEELTISLRLRYGELLDLKEIAEVFKYKTIAAVRKANSRGTLPVNLYRFPNKSGWYAKVIEVAKSIEEMKSSQ